MRTTITIDDSLLERLKRQAAERGTTVSQLIEESVRLMDHRASAGAAPAAFELVTFGKGGRFTRVDVDDTSSLQELADLERFGAKGS